MLELQTFLTQNWLNLVALIWFLICFKGYMLYAERKARTTACLSSIMHLYRTEWMRRMLDRDMRMADTAAIANLERSVSFFASTTILVLAGLMTLLSYTERAITLVEHLPLVRPATPLEWELKLLVLLTLFIYAFFKFTWSLRQYGFVSVMVGSSPGPADGLDEKHLQAHAARIARMSSIAANNSNLGLRTYYFSLAVLAWLINPWLFMAMSAGIVYVLYQREFTSPTLKTLLMSTEI
ncbi:DUF599 family protein [Marinobacterium sp. D7]|uniref:DUF599 domain-containing protein n=1 Tax=Marinobacterium ramblicola TaxID=2849041 RepID=UPI001C2CE31C|nr:DUF599 family protein [Marinobacterium ramblicola]MBV1787584.1 DUF599 family protein [Marinobacterium ramblicola]